LHLNSEIKIRLKFNLTDEKINEVKKKVKKMKNKVLMAITAIVMVAVLASCGKKPQVEIDATNAAIEAAKTAEANVYVPAEFTALQDSMSTVMADITAQESKLLKKFGPSKEKLASTLALANQVAANAAVKKNEVKKEAETLIAGIKTIGEENAKLLPKLPRGKEGAAVIEQIKADLASIDASVAEAQGMYDKGAYMDALNKIKAANTRAADLNTEIKEVLTKARIRF
jgi:predicted small lipoprotein YifL